MAARKIKKKVQFIKIHEINENQFHEIFGGDIYHRIMKIKISHDIAK